MPTCTSDLLRTDDAPHRSARVWNNLGQLLSLGTTMHNRKRVAAELFDSNVVFHPNDLRRCTTRPSACPARCTLHLDRPTCGPGVCPAWCGLLAVAPVFRFPPR